VGLRLRSSSVMRTGRARSIIRHGSADVSATAGRATESWDGRGEIGTEPAASRDDGRWPKNAFAGRSITRAKLFVLRFAGAFPLRLAERTFAG
jgi:hypothetical protein